MMRFRQVELNPRERTLIEARDALGMPLVHASQHELPLPIVLHPSAHLAVIYPYSKTDADGEAKSTDDKTEIMQALCSGLHSVVLDGKVRLCAAAGGAGEIVWNAELARFFARVLDAGVESLDIRLLRPIAYAVSDS